VEDQRSAQAILDRWRELERQLAGIAPDTLAAQLVRIEADQLRAEYQVLVGEVIDEGGEW
jgi:DNA-binding HxlR family transcriptional regulator